MDALITGTLNTSDPELAHRQAQSLAAFSLAFCGSGELTRDIPRELGNSADALVFNHYNMTSPEAVVYQPRQDGARASAETIASAFAELTGVPIPVKSFDGDLSRLSHDGLVVVDAASQKDGVPAFEFSDISRRQAIRGRNGVDPQSGLAAIGRLTHRFIDAVTRLLSDRRAAKPWACDETSRG